MNSGAYVAGHLAGAVIAYAIIFGGIFASGIYFSKHLTKKRKDGSVVRWPVRSALVVILLLLLGQCSTSIRAQSTVDGNEEAGVVIQQFVAGPASNFPSIFTADFIRNYDNGMRDGIVDTFGGKDMSISPSAVAISTAVVSVAGRKILKSQIQVPSRLFGYQFSGASGGNVIAVVCVSTAAKPFDTAGTQCERAVAKVFGS